MTDNTAQQIAIELSQIWYYQKSPEFGAYIENTYGHKTNVIGPFSCLLIAEAECGDAFNGMIGGIIRRWWVMSDAGLSSLNDVSLLSQINSLLNADQSLYTHPIVKFYYEGDVITIGEDYGPEFVCRKVGKIKQVGDHIAINDLKIVWVATSLGKRQQIENPHNGTKLE
jgi:hypothetical protein